MELNNEHRKSLLNELAKAKEELTLQNICLIKEQAKRESDSTDLVECFEVACFLAQERIKLIEKSLIENEIDY